MSIHVRLVHGGAAATEADRIWPVYDEIFGDWSDAGHWRDELFLRHVARDGFRLVLAEDDTRLIGFAWGHRGAGGQFWSDWVTRELPGVAATWIGGHDELVEMGVVAPHRGQGIAGRMLDAYLAEAGERTMLSTEPSADSAAVRLYRSRGFVHLGHLAPDVHVMGRRR